MMGLSMIKSVENTDNLIALIAGLYMWHDSPVIRRNAKKNLFEQVPNQIRSTIENWNPKYQSSNASKLEVVTKELINAFDETPLNDVKLWKWAIFRNTGWEFTNHYPST